jgi:hypothetical protein
MLVAAHLYHGERVDGVRVAFHPEGILSTLPALCPSGYIFFCAGVRCDVTGCSVSPAPS